MYKSAVLQIKMFYKPIKKKRPDNWWLLQSGSDYYRNINILNLRKRLSVIYSRQNKTCAIVKKQLFSLNKIKTNSRSLKRLYR